MTAAFANPSLITLPAATGAVQRGGASVSACGAFRRATDPLFYADLTLDNIVVGSRYRVTRRADGSELALGVAGSTTEVLVGLPVFSNPMLVDITVRNASGSPVYKIFDTAAFIDRDGAVAFILQQTE